MKTTLWKRLFGICLISGATFFAFKNSAWLRACIGPAWGSGEEGRFWLFQPNLSGVAGLLPYSYSVSDFYADNSLENQNTPFDSTHYNMNVAEWQSVLRGGVSDAKAVYSVLYQTDPDRFFKRQDSLKNNVFVAALAKPENAELKNYLWLAKRCEQAINTPIDYWDENAKRDMPLIKKTLAEAQKMTETAALPFVKERAAYQMLKLQQYAGDTVGSVKTFDTYFKNSKSASWVNASSRFYYALTRTGDEQQYLLTRVFAETTDKRLRAIQLFESERIEDIAKLAKNNAEKANMYVMKSLRNPAKGLADMEKIYSLDATNPDFAKLIEREVNKVESWLMSERMTGLASDAHFAFYTDSEEYNKTSTQIWKEDFEYAKKYMAFLEKIIAEKKIKDIQFAQLSLAHVAFVMNDTDKYNQNIAALNGQKMPKNSEMQVKILAYTQKMADLKRFDSTTPSANNSEGEALTMEILDFIKNNAHQINNAALLKEQILRYVGVAAIDKGSLAKGNLTLNKTRLAFGSYGFGWSMNFYDNLMTKARPADYDEAIRILYSPQNSYEKYLAEGPKPYQGAPEYLYEWNEQKQAMETIKLPAQGWNFDRLKDDKATYYIWCDKLDSALLVFNTISPTYWDNQVFKDYFTRNPFKIQNLDIPNTTLDNDSTVYTKKTFVEKLLQIKKEAAQNDAKRAQNELLLGAAYYNMTAYGNAWLMNKKGTGSFDFPNPRIAAEDLPNVPTKKSSTAAPQQGRGIVIFVGLSILALAYYFRKKYASVATLLLVLAFWSCKKDTPSVSKVNSDFFDKNYYGCALAAEHFQAALSLTKEANEAAIAAFMVELCHKNMQDWQFEKSLEGMKWEEAEKKRTAWKATESDALAIFKKTFKSNDVNQNLMMSCTYFETFIKK